MSDSEDDLHEEEECVAKYKDYIQKSKSQGCSPDEISTVSVKESVSLSFVDALTNQEIEEIRQKLFAYWESTAAKESETEVKELMVPTPSGSDPKTQCEEAVTSFEDAKSGGLISVERLQDIAKLVEIELQKRRQTKLSEGLTEKSETGKLRRSENIDFTELKKKAADLPGMVELASPKTMEELPFPRKTDPLEMILRVYECTKVVPGGSVEYNAEERCIDISLVPKLRKNRKFRRRLLVEMSLIFDLLMKPLRTQPIPEEPEDNSSSSRTKDSSIDSRSSLPMSPPDVSSTSHYPEDTTRSLVVTPKDDTMSTLDSDSSASGLLNEPAFELLEGAQKEESSSGSSEGSSNKTQTSSTTVCSEETLSEISSLPTDTTSGGARASLSSLRDAEGLPMSLSRPHLFIDDEAFEVPSGSVDVPPLDPGQLVAGQLVGIPGQLISGQIVPGQLVGPGQMVPGQLVGAPGQMIPGQLVGIPGQLASAPGELVPGQSIDVPEQLITGQLGGSPGQLASAPGQLVPGQLVGALGQLVPGHLVDALGQLVPGQLDVPELPLSLDSSEDALADEENIARRRRERSPREDNDKNAPKRHAV